MTAPVIDAQPVINAIKAAVSAKGVAFAEGKKPAVAVGAPYIVAFFDTGTVSDRSLVSRDGFSLYCSFQCAGNLPESARFAVVKLRAAILGLRGATFAGRTVQMPVHEVARPMDRDDDAEPAVFVQIDEWRLKLT